MIGVGAFCASSLLCKWIALNCIAFSFAIPSIILWGLVFDFVSNHRLLPRQILNCPVCKLGGFCTARSRWFRQEVNQALMSAVSKNFVISFFVRSVVPVKQKPCWKPQVWYTKMVMRKFLSSLSAGTVPGTGENHLQVKQKVQTVKSGP